MTTPSKSLPETRLLTAARNWATASLNLYVFVWLLWLVQ